MSKRLVSQNETLAYLLAPSSRWIFPWTLHPHWPPCCFPVIYPCYGKRAVSELHDPSSQMLGLWMSGMRLENEACQGNNSEKWLRIIQCTWETLVSLHAAVRVEECVALAECVDCTRLSLMRRLCSFGRVPVFSGVWKSGTFVFRSCYAA